MERRKRRKVAACSRNRPGYLFPFPRGVGIRNQKAGNSQDTCEQRGLQTPLEPMGNHCLISTIAGVLRFKALNLIFLLSFLVIVEANDVTHVYLQHNSFEESIDKKSPF